MPSTDKYARLFETSQANNPNSALFASRYKVLKAKRQDYQKRIDAAQTDFDDAIECINRLNTMLESSRSRRNEAERDLKKLPETKEYKLVSACMKSLAKAPSPDYEEPQSVIHSSTMILFNPTNCPDMNANNVCKVESVNFETGVLVFKLPAVQSTWSLVQHLFRIEPLNTVYDVEREEGYDSADKDKYELKKWTVADCASNDIGFLKRIDEYDGDSEVDHSAFVSLCRTDMPLDLSLFDKALVNYAHGTAKDSVWALATLHLIAIKPLTVMDTCISK